MKYKGERLPRLRDVLDLARAHGILLKIDNRYEHFPEHIRRLLYAEVKESGAPVAFTVTSLSMAEEAMAAVPGCQIHYDGVYAEETVAAFGALVPAERLVVWLPMETADTRWVKTGFATAEKCETVRKYARLGLWNLITTAEYERANGWGAYVVETNGRLKPTARRGLLPDTHVHSEFSHDSDCPIDEIAETAEAYGTRVVAVTDHCDVEYWATMDLSGNARRANTAVREAGAHTEEVRLLSGIEISEGPWNAETAERIVGEIPFDAVIGSVHAVRYEGYQMPYSKIDFSQMSEETLDGYLKAYFEEVREIAEETEMDILAHLTCPMRYINGKYGLGVDLHRYEDQITGILETVIRRKIALEINTSCLGSPYDTPMPEDWIIALYRMMGGHLVTLGSDAHVPERIGYRFDIAATYLRALGFSYVCYFEGRRIRQCTI